MAGAGVLSVRHESRFPQQEIIRRDWLFKLVGKETFTVGSANTKATIIIEAISGFAYEYTLEVAGKSLQKFIYNRAQTTKTWLLKVDGEDCRVVLGEPRRLLSAVWDYVTAVWSSVFARGNVGDTLKPNLLRLRSMQLF